MLKNLSSIVFALLLFAGAAYTQSGTGTGLRGRVADPSGQAVVAAAVEVENVATADSRSVTTDLDGAWEVRSLTPGQYRVSAEKDGFKRLVRTGITVTSLEMTTLDLELEIGQVMQTINVTADAEMVDAGSSTIVRTLDNRELESLPTSARNFTQLLVIQPGVSADISELLSNNNASISPSVNGARTTANSFFFNGVDVTNLLCCNSRITGDRGTLDEGGGSLSRNIAPAPETLAEVKLQTSLYDAATGRSGGGNFMLVSKSGTNEFHGSAYYFLQNEKLIANDFFYNKFGLDRQRLRRHEGGFTFGGPVLIPKAYNGKNRTFFFGSYQRTQADTSYVDQASTIVRLPRALTDDRSREGVLQFMQSIWNPENYGPYDPPALDETSLALLQARFPDGRFLIPSGSGGQFCEEEDLGETCQVISVIPATFKQDQFSIGMDHDISAANKLKVKFFFTDQPSDDPFYSSDAASRFQSREETAQRTVSLTDTHVFGPSVINEFRAGYFLNTNSTLAVPYFLGSDFGIRSPLAGERPDMPQIAIEGSEDIGDDFVFGTPGDDTIDRQETFIFGNTLSVIKGRHSLRFGGEVKRHLLRGDLLENKNGDIQAQSWTSFLTVGQENPAEDGDSEQLAISLNYGETLRHYRMWDWSWFAADDWKVSRSLTLNLGVRHDFFGFPSERDGFLSTYDFNAAMQALASGSPHPVQDGFVFASNFDQQSYPGAEGLPLTFADSKQIIPSNYWNIMPRFGFAWQPSAGKGIVIRGGYGIYHDRISAAFANSLRQSPPFFREAEVDGTGDWNDWPDDVEVLPVPAFVVGFDDGEPILATEDDPEEEFEALEMQVVERLKNPYMQQWNLNIQWEFARNWMVDLGYVGSKGTRLLQFRNQGQAFDVAALGGFLPRPGDVPTGGFIGNYFEVDDDDNFINSLEPTCDITDDPGDCTIGAELRGPMLGFDEDEGVNTAFSDANSAYHSLQASLLKRYSSGITFNLNYTFSRTIDYFSDEGIYQVEHDQRNWRLNRGLSDFHRKHRFIFSWTWDLPLRGNRFVEGWQISGIGTFQSGRPFTVVGNDLSAFLFTSTNPRPNLVDGSTHEDQMTSGGSPSSRVDNYLDAGVFENSGPQFGSLGRNTTFTPWQRRFDVSLSKRTLLTERINLEFRAEAYNLSNTPSFRTPERNIEESSFGEIQQMRGGPRVFQLGLKLLF